MISRNMELEAHLIDDLVDPTQIMDGNVRLSVSVIDAHAAVAAAVEVCAQSAAAKSLDLQLSLDASDHHVRGDSIRLQQVFWNLIANAVKFTPPHGHVMVRTRNKPAAAESGAAHSSLIIEIADTGVGIEQSRLSTVFSVFEQSRESHSGHFGGVGMGLAISKALIDMHGGSIDAYSDGPGRGALVRIALPALRMAAAEPVASALDKPKRLRILVVEDHDGCRWIMARLLRGIGHEVTVASDIRSALTAIGSGSFDLLISDVCLPDGSGLDLMRLAHQAQGIRGICVSGLGMDEDFRRSHEAGFAAHLVKPISFQTLQAAIVKAAS